MAIAPDKEVTATERQADNAALNTVRANETPRSRTTPSERERESGRRGAGNLDTTPAEPTGPTGPIGPTLPVRPTISTGPTLPASTNLIAPDGTVFQDPTAYAAYVGYLSDKTSAFDIKKRESQSAFDLMYAEFANYGLAALVEPLRNLVQNGISGAEFTLRLRETDAYKKRFAANADRIAKGLSALSEGEYLAKEDAYQNIMRNYGLPESYYAKDSLGTQAGFNKLLANDVSAAELESRIFEAKDKVLNANPEVAQALKAFYPGITDGDILGYVLDPKNALKEIQRKVAAAEIGGAALAQGLTAGVTRAEELAGLGVTKAAATAGYADVAQMAPLGSELAAIYGQGQYGQAEAEAEVFNASGAAEATKKRKKLSALETSSFSGSSGVGALGRERGNNYGTTQSGFGSY